MHPVGKLHVRHLLARLLHEGGDVAADYVGRDRLHALAAEMLHLVAAGSLVHVGDLMQRHERARRRAQRQVADLGDAVAAFLIEHRYDVEDAVALVALAHDVALVGGAQHVQDVDRYRAPSVRGQPCAGGW